MNHEIEKLMIEREELDKKYIQLKKDIQTEKIKDCDVYDVEEQLFFMKRYGCVLSKRIDKLKSRT